MGVFRIFILIIAIASLQSCGRKVEGLETSAVKSGQEGSVAGEGLDDDIKIIEEEALSVIECMTDESIAEITIYEKNIEVVINDTREIFEVNEDDLALLDFENIAIQKSEDNRDFIRVNRETGEYAVEDTFEKLTNCVWDQN